MPAFDKMIACIEMTRIMLSNVKINKEAIKDERYKYMFTVEEVNQMVLDGIPFRDAYKKIGQIVEEGTHESLLKNNGVYKKLSDLEFLA